MKSWHAVGLSAFLFLTILAGLGALACGSGNQQGINGNGQGTATLTPTQTPNLCAGVTDKSIIDSIYGRLITAGIGPQVFQVNITIKGGVVTLYGWAAPDTVHDKIVQIAAGTNCVTSVVSTPNFYSDPNNPTRPSPGCADGFRRCGDICIPNTDRCSFDLDNNNGNTNANTEPTKSMSNANANTNSNSNSNSNTHK